MAYLELCVYFEEEINHRACEFLALPDECEASRHLAEEVGVAGNVDGGPDAVDGPQHD